MENINLMLGDNIELLKKLTSNSVDSIVTDPPYGLSFMNKKWDYQVPSVEFWKEVYRVLKPGGYILSFGGTRTYHRMVVNIEDAGFEIRDQIQWIYGSGFPKSHNIGKAVDKLEGNQREVVGVSTIGGGGASSKGLIEFGSSNKDIGKNGLEITKGNSDYEGWGTALKPANEPICLARKPLSEKTVAENVIKYSTGGINIDGCRVDSNIINNEGRFPANIILDEEAAKLLDEQSGISKSVGGKGEATKKSLDRTDIGYGYKKIDNASGLGGYLDKGGASRFFYIAKVSKNERNLGLDKNNHPTIKPINLMTYLCRLITPKGGTVLDPFMGSGSSGISACLEGFNFIGMEMDEDYFKIAQARINNFEQYRKLLK